MLSKQSVGWTTIITSFFFLSTLWIICFWSFPFGIFRQGGLGTVGEQGPLHENQLQTASSLLLTSLLIWELKWNLRLSVQADFANTCGTSTECLCPPWPHCPLSFFMYSQIPKMQKSDIASHHTTGEYHFLHAFLTKLKYRVSPHLPGGTTWGCRDQQLWFHGAIFQHWKAGRLHTEDVTMRCSNGVQKQ